MVKAAAIILFTLQVLALQEVLSCGCGCGSPTTCAVQPVIRPVEVPRPCLPPAQICQSWGIPAAPPPPAYYPPQCRKSCGGPKYRLKQYQPSLLQQTIEALKQKLAFKKQLLFSGLANPCVAPLLQEQAYGGLCQ